MNPLLWIYRMECLVLACFNSRWGNFICHWVQYKLEPVSSFGVSSSLRLLSSAGRMELRISAISSLSRKQCFWSLLVCCEDNSCCCSTICSIPWLLLLSYQSMSFYLERFRSPLVVVQGFFHRQLVCLIC